MNYVLFVSTPSLSRFSTTALQFMMNGADILNEIDNLSVTSSPPRRFQTAALYALPTRTSASNAKSIHHYTSTHLAIYLIFIFFLNYLFNFDFLPNNNF